MNEFLFEAKKSAMAGCSCRGWLKLATPLFTSTLSGRIYPHSIVCARECGGNMKKERLQLGLQ